MPFCCQYVWPHVSLVCLSAGIQPGGRGQEASYGRQRSPMPNGDIEDDLRSEDRYLQKLAERNDQTKDYFKSKRQDKLLTKVQEDKNRCESKQNLNSWFDIDLLSHLWIRRLLQMN